MEKIIKRILGIVLLVAYIIFNFLKKHKDTIIYILVLAGFVYMLIFGILHNTVYGDGLGLIKLIKNGRII